MFQINTHHQAYEYIYPRYNIKYRYDNIINSFTRAELYSLGAIRHPDAKENNLQLIHPLYARDKWETSLPQHLAFYPLGRGREGYWKPDNEIVWEILKPCIALASQFLQNIHCTHWWSACVNSDWEIHPSSQEDLQLHRFRRRAGAQAPQEDRKALQNILKLLGETLTFRISSAYCNPKDGMPSNAVHEAVTIIQNGTVMIHIPFERLAPLLENLGTSERIAEQFNVAISLVHETAHALCWVLAKRKLLDEASEPYFEDESLAEVGYSVTKAIMGGNVDAITWQRIFASQEQRLAQNRGIFLTEWPNFSTINPNSREPCLDPELAASSYNLHPITIKHMSNLQQQEYWDNAVHTYGHNAVKVYPPEGRRQDPHSVLLEHVFNESQEGPFDSTIADNLDLRMLKAHLILHAFQKRPNILETHSTAVDTTHPPPSDPIFSSLLNILLNNATSLALDTQGWLPVPLFLSYLNSLPICATRPILSHLLESFLHSCDFHNQYFKYLPDGSGLIRPIHTSFPSITRPRTAQPLYDEEYNDIHSGFVKRLESMWEAYIGNRGANDSDIETFDLEVAGGKNRSWILSDIDADLLYSIFLSGAPETGIACRENFDTVMAWEVQEGRNWTYAPKGLYRRVRRRF